jgi:hypothetical protein
MRGNCVIPEDPGLASAWRSAALQGKLHVEASGLLQVSYDLEEITRLGISLRAEHAHEALCRCSRQKTGQNVSRG